MPQPGRLPQSVASHESWRKNFGAPLSRLSTRPARIPASEPRNAAKPRPSRAIFCDVATHRADYFSGDRRRRQRRGPGARCGGSRLMLEHSVYSVISPEGCAAILWDDPAKIPGCRGDAENDRRRSFQARRDRRSDPGTDRRRPPRSGDRRKTHRQIVHHPSRSVNRSQPRGTA